MLSKKDIMPIIIILAALVIGIQLYPGLPQIVPSHWNAQGEVDGWSSGEFIPVLALAIYLLKNKEVLSDVRFY